MNFDEQNQDQNQNAYDNLEMEERLKVPLSRLGVVIGPKGTTKRKLEKLTKTTLTIDSEEGNVIIRPAKDIDDPTLVWIARDIIKAIGRGFSEEKAFRLVDNDNYLIIITLEGNTPRQLARLRGRIIGGAGKARNIIEMSTETVISVQGRTVSIIGQLEELDFARKAIEMLIDGYRHGTVFRYLERYRTQKKNEAVQIWKKKIELRDDN